MKKCQISCLLVSLLLMVSLSACSVFSALSPTQTPTSTLQPTLTPTPTITPTATPTPFYLDATVFPGDLQVPIIIYHQFNPDYGETNATKMRFSDFKDELQTLYDSGFSLISLKDWIEGDFVVPAGRKPLILTLDDLWFGNQIFIRDDGTPSPNSGIGILWQFSKDHPDFGFHAALFAIYGDKFYPAKEVGDAFYAADDVTDFFSKSWHIKLGNTVAWAMQNGLEVYNHTFTHPSGWKKGDGTPLTNAEILDELKKNDYWLRQFLTESGHEDLIPQLDNMIALPEGKWPESDSGKQIILTYKNPEGKPVMAIMEAYNSDDLQLTPSVFSPNFDPMHIVRMTASHFMIDFVLKNKDAVPTAVTCPLNLQDETQAANLDAIQAAIQNSITTKACPEGIYNVSGNVFVARSGAVTLFKTAASDTTIAATPTP